MNDREVTSQEEVLKEKEGFTRTFYSKQVHKGNKEIETFMGGDKIKPILETQAKSC